MMYENEFKHGLHVRKRYCDRIVLGTLKQNLFGEAVHDVFVDVQPCLVIFALADKAGSLEFPNMISIS